MSQTRDPFKPGRLGPVELPNRIIKAATSEGRSPDGLVTDSLIDFHLDHVRGGVGMTTVAYCCVSKEGASAPGQILMTKRAAPGLAKLTAAVHAESGTVSAQLGHAGPVASKKITGVTAVAPSRMVNPTSLEYCRQITSTEIADVIEHFRDAAALAADCGFDAVELHFGHNYLPSSFLSPLFNRRTDSYGGGIDARSRLVREIAAEVRTAVGDSVAVTAKISMDDGIPGGIDLAESIRTAQLLDADGNIDALELTQGSSVMRQMYLFRGEVPVRDFASVMPQPFKTGVYAFGRKMLGEYPYYDLYMLESARQFVPVMTNTQVILLGGITNFDHMVTGLNEGFDFVALGRALLREPDLVNTIRADRAKDSLCTHCNRCMYTVYGKTHCVLDPDSAYGAPGPAEFLGMPKAARRAARQLPDSARTKHGV
ncbi:NADH:flavin oxidoreductase [Gordonia liuliyuniae]|uniref:NADH:flavin oxidoreductase n=1 Tax=Gordonia liuliyuniae TaxID=2911517 RepID=A0ABS9IQB7_9ACTN|nr:NADH:flavin oxidoreductase [Gordonia liuliyuniae]MCF8587725.1 NADH:flavin oxidoreductase [Gordonia liuliyuniae]